MFNKNKSTLFTVLLGLFLVFVLLASQTPAVYAATGRTPTRTRTRTATPVAYTSTPTMTPPPVITATPTVFGVCSPVVGSITAPMTFDGAGSFCWQSTNLGSYVYTAGVLSLKINGVEYANQLIIPSSWPPKINGLWYVSYYATAPYGHLEFK